MIPKTRPIPSATTPYTAPSATASISDWRRFTASRKVGGGQLPCELLGARRVGRGQGQAQLRVREHVRAVGERDGQRAALLDEEDRHAALADGAERLEERLDDGRREPERGL